MQNLGIIGGKTWRKVGERRGENVRRRRGEGWRNVRRLAGRRRGEDVEREKGKVVERCGEWLVEDVRKMWRREVGKICRKVFEERLAIVRY